MEKLKPCPFCREKLEIGLLGYREHSKNRGCIFDGAIVANASAAKKWNTRPEEDALRARVEELETHLKEAYEMGGPVCPECGKTQDYPYDGNTKDFWCQRCGHEWKSPVETEDMSDGRE